MEFCDRQEQTLNIENSSLEMPEMVQESLFYSPILIIVYSFFGVMILKIQDKITPRNVRYRNPLIQVIPSLLKIIPEIIRERTNPENLKRIG